MNRIFDLKKNVVLLFGCLLFFNVNVFGQKPETVLDSNTIIKIWDGKTVKTATLERYDDKLLVLDFFMTSCGSCIEAFPKLNKLQLIFGDSLAILPVTFEAEARVTRFFRSNPNTRNNKLPVAVDDKELKKAFPHRFVPHIVWIYKGRTIAITQADMLTEENIKSLLNGGMPSNWPVKNDFATLEEKNTEMEDVRSFSYLKDYLTGEPLQYIRDTIDEGRKIRYKWINVPPVSAVLYAYSKFRKMPLMKKERIVLEVQDPTRFVCPPEMPPSLWESRYAIVYEAVFESDIPEVDRMKRILKDMEGKLGTNIRIEQRDAPVWEIVSDTVRTSSPQKYGKMQRLSFAMKLLEITYPEFPPIVMQQGIEDEEIALGNVTDFKSLATELVKNGFVLIETKRPIECLVISDL